MFSNSYTQKLVNLRTKNWSQHQFNARYLSNLKQLNWNYRHIWFLAVLLPWVLSFSRYSTFLHFFCQLTNELIIFINKIQIIFSESFLNDTWMTYILYALPERSRCCRILLQVRACDRDLIETWLIPLLLKFCKSQVSHTCISKCTYIYI